MIARLHRQRGVYSVTFALFLVLILGMFGLVFDLSMVYARRAELQGAVQASALAAGRALDGTMAGLATARSNAKSRAEANNYLFKVPLTWDDSALRFAASPDASDGAWLSAGSINASNVGAMRYARVDAAALGHGQSDTTILFGHFLNLGDTVSQNVHAVAGRSLIQVTPLAICAISSAPASSRPNPLGAGNEELLEYGFRRGVTYNLLKLNPNGTEPANYLVNPVDFPGAPNHSAHLSETAVSPFVCSGTMVRPGLPPGTGVYVRSPFPPALADALNSRFEQYAASDGCSRVTAPPDARNIRDFSAAYGGWWMTASPAPSRGGAQDAIVAGALLTIGESPIVLAGTTPASYGTLWSFAKAVRYSASAPGNVGSAFGAADWNKLYQVASGQVASNFSDNFPRPYLYPASPHRVVPSNPGVTDRRVLNIPLLACPVSGSSATVLAVGRFLLTTPATSAPAAVHAEFGGLATDATLGASASLFQ
jgi:hypothetical protein